jgi:hypothetical protein
MLAMELIPAIRERLAELDAERGTSLASGRRAALWRAQQQAARLTHTTEDLRRYCLDSIAPRPFLDESDYLRGFREGLVTVLEDIRRLEHGGGRT